MELVILGTLAFCAILAYTGEGFHKVMLAGLWGLGVLSVLVAIARGLWGWIR